MKMKRWRMKMMVVTTKMENLTSMDETSYDPDIADRGIAGTLMMKTRAIKSVDQPPSCWQR